MGFILTIPSARASQLLTCVTLCGSDRSDQSSSERAAFITQISVSRLRHFAFSKNQFKPIFCFRTLFKRYFKLVNEAGSCCRSFCFHPFFRRYVASQLDMFSLRSNSIYARVALRDMRTLCAWNAIALRRASDISRTDRCISRTRSVLYHDTEGVYITRRRRYITSP